MSPSQTKVLERKDGTKPGVAHVVFATAEEARAAKKLNWADLQSAGLQVGVATVAAVTEERRKEVTSNKRTLADNMVTEAEVKVAKKGVAEPVGNLSGTCREPLGF